MTRCKNCAFEYEGKFCPQCGQKAKTKRITNRSVLEEVRRSLIHYDRGFAYTVIQLFRRPGHTVREFIEGKRVMHVKPVKFMLWATALNFLVFHLVGLDKDLIQALVANQNAMGHPSQPAIQTQFSQYIFNHPSILMFLMIPNIAFFSWLFFRRRGYNYAEHFVLNAYLMGEVSMFGIALNPVSKYLGGINGAFFYLKIGLQSLIWIGYMCWGYTQFFQPQKKWQGWAKSILSILFGYLLLLLVISILVALFIIVFWPWIEPNFQK